MPEEDLSHSYASIFSNLDSEPFFISDDATDLVWYQNNYSKGVQRLAKKGSDSLVVKTQLLEAETGKILTTLHESSLAVSVIESRSKGLVAQDASAYRGKKAFVRVTVDGLAPEVAGVVSGVTEVYIINEEKAGKQQPKVLAAMDASKSESFALLPNYPNPFNPETTIRYSLPEAGWLVLKIYDIRGRQVVTLINAEQPAGMHTTTWNSRDRLGREVASGVYFYRLQFKDQVKSGKMILMR